MLFRSALLIFAACGVLLFIYLRKKKREQELQAELDAQLAAETVSGIDLLADEDLSIEDLTNKDSETTEKIFKLVETNPEAVAQLLRNWLDDEYGR